MLEVMIIPGALIGFLLTWAAAEAAVQSTTPLSAAPVRYEPVADMPPLVVQRSPWRFFHIW